MKLHDDYYEEEHSSGSKMTYVYMALIMSVIILGVTALVFWANQSKSKSDGSGYAAALAQKEAKAAEERRMEANSSENVSTKSKLTSNDLDIWTLPDTGREKNSTQSNRNNGTVTNQTTGETVIDGSSSASDSKEQSKTADELSNGKTSVYDMTTKEDASKEKKSEENETETSQEDEKERRTKKRRRTRKKRSL